MSEEYEEEVSFPSGGLASSKARAEEGQRLISWGFREFNNYALFKAGETVEQAAVWLGEQPAVPLVVGEDVVLTLPRKARKEMTVKLVYEAPIPAPIQQGQQVARLVVEAPDQKAIEIPLVAGASVELLGPVGRLVSGVKYLVFGGPGL